jgi:hypothetical protein
MTYKFQFNTLGFLVLMILIPGCIWGSVKFDRVLGKDRIKNIESGKTTRNNILKWFGPPAILAGKTGTVSLPPLKADSGEIRKVDSNTFFKYFLVGHDLSEHHVVYYYFDEWEKINGVSIPIGNTLFSLPLTSTDLQFSELWVLVNRETGQVEDYVFLEAEEK